MKILRILPFVIAILFLPLMLCSKGVPYSAALQVARNFCIQNGHKAELVADRDSSVPGSIIQLMMQHNIPLYYRVHLQSHKGFILVAADDRMPPVLG